MINLWNRQRPESVNVVSKWESGLRGSERCLLGLSSPRPLIKSLEASGVKQRDDVIGFVFEKITPLNF